MNFADLIQSASSSLMRSKARTFLTIIAIVIGAMTITLTNGIGTGIKSYLSRQLGNLGAGNVLTIQLVNKSSPALGASSNAPAKYNPNQQVVSSAIGRGEIRQLLMTPKDLATIKAIPNITDVTPGRVISPDYIMGNGGKYQLALQQQFGVAAADMVAGAGVDNNSSKNQVTVPESYVNSLGYDSAQAIIGTQITIGITSAAGKHSSTTAIVTGVQQLAIIGSSFIYANSPLATQLYSLQSEGLPVATTDSFSTVEAVFPNNFTTSQIDKIKSDLKAEGYVGETVKDRENTLFTALNVIIIVFDMFGAIALLAASLGIVNTLLMSVQERTKEIGLMKALGMGPRRIFALFSIEAVLIGFWGSLAGVALAALFGKMVNTIAAKTFLSSFPGLTLLTFPLATVAVVIVIIMVIAFVAGTLPAFRASKKDPIEALRYE